MQCFTNRHHGDSRRGQGRPRRRSKWIQWTQQQQQPPPGGDTPQDRTGGRLLRQDDQAG